MEKSKTIINDDVFMVLRKKFPALFGVAMWDAIAMMRRQKKNPERKASYDSQANSTTVVLKIRRCSDCYMGEFVGKKLHKSIFRCRLLKKEVTNLNPLCTVEDWQDFMVNHLRILILLAWQYKEECSPENLVFEKFFSWLDRYYIGTTETTYRLRMKQCSKYLRDRLSLDDSCFQKQAAMPQEVKDEENVENADEVEMSPEEELFYALQNDQFDHSDEDTPETPQSE